MQRAWRLTAMFIIVVLLLTAIGSTGNYDFRDGSWSVATIDWTTPINDTQWADRLEQWRLMGHLITPLPTSLALCHFYMLHELDGGKAVYIPSIFSILILGLSFLSRLTKAFKLPGGQKITLWKSKIENFFRGSLHKIYTRADCGKRRHNLCRTLVYWPLLMVFVMWSMVIDYGTSLTLEVWLLLVSFCWGIVRIVSTLAICGSRQHTWSFGQVLPVFLLLAPLLTLSRLVTADDSEDRSLEPSQDSPETPKSHQQHVQDGQIRQLRADSERDGVQSADVPDDPFQDFNTDRSYVNDTVTFLSLIVGYKSGFIIAAQYYAERDPSDDMSSVFWGSEQVSLPVINDFISLYGFLYLRFNLEILFNKYLKRATLRVITRTGLILLVFAFWVVASRGWLLILSPVQPFLLILLCIMFWVIWHCVKACQAGIRVWKH